MYYLHFPKNRVIMFKHKVAVTLYVLSMIIYCDIYANDCYTPTVKEALNKKGYLIFVGTILCKEELSYFDSLHSYKRYFQSCKVLVHSIYRGRIKKDTLIVSTNDNLEVGIKYIIYARNTITYPTGYNKKILWASSLCTRMRVYSEAEILEMNKVIKPRKIHNRP